MFVSIARIGNGATVKFAAEELSRLLTAMDCTAFADIRIYDSRDEARSDLIFVGLDGSCEANKDDDAVYIDVKNGAGIITGANERSVLIAVYRFAFELGCRFLRPGKAGEKIPSKKLSPELLTVKVDEKASYRHRSMCIEGGNAYEHIKNMIDWLPKVGMNGYFVQFQTPASFFKRFYNEPNPYFTKISVEDEDVDRIWAKLEEEIALRGLNYHAVGHGWTCEPFGIHASNWSQYTGEIPEDAVQHFAKVDGVRELWQKSGLLTNCCYSNPKTRDIMTDAVVEYCKAHPTVNYLHFWLGDAKNNQCECDECVKMIPSDYYVMMLNELDEKLTAAGLDTKVVALIYLDLLWAPEKLKIKNTDRTVLMFAPITRTYTTAFTDFDPTAKVEIAPYVRNKLVMPTSVAENVAMLKKWQDEQQLKDSFDFDYHLMWDHYDDPGYYECARILHTDMANLYKIGLNGMVSCQANRAAFPTGLPLYSMARALWDKTSVFEDVASEYFTAAFGEDGSAVKAYLSTLSKLFCPPYIRGEKPISPEEMFKNITEAKNVINTFDVDFIKSRLGASEDVKHLEYHADICRMYVDLLSAGLRGDRKAYDAAKDAMNDYMYRTEFELSDYFDVRTFNTMWIRYPRIFTFNDETA